ncbi:MAG TPA: ribosome-binding factor A [Candidatus Azoamicus sp. OHIO1]
MKTTSIRIKKINRIIQKKLSEILNEKIYKSKTNIITITEVITDINLLTSKIFISTLKDAITITRNLNNSSAKLRAYLSNKMYLYKIPKLIFIHDSKTITTIELENLIDKANTLI